MARWGGLNQNPRPEALLSPDAQGKLLSLCHFTFTPPPPENLPLPRGSRVPLSLLFSLVLGRERSFPSPFPGSVTLGLPRSDIKLLLGDLA